MSNKEELESVKESYYQISLVFKVTRDVLNEVEDDSVVESRKILYDKLRSYFNSQEYEVFSSSVVIYQTQSDYSYLICYNSFIRGANKLPMDGYVTTGEIKESIKYEFIRFFESISLEYKLINIKSLHE